MLESLREPLSDKYEMQSLLGAGGMGAVYLARDVKHDRSVAIKVLHPEFAVSLGAERFLREIGVTAKLSHPHILPLYDSGNADGFLYYVMPLLEGEDLGERMLREKQLPIKDAVMIAKEVAEALGYAHSMGLVHRDIKPGNIMLSGGHAIVVDFGIARAVDAAADSEKITQTGMSVGTPAYMAPEQAMAETVDGRADLYSLGCVIYEMVVGQIPFTGPTPPAIMARHAMDAVPPPTIMRDAIPDELEDIIMQALAKTPADRFQTGLEMAEALDMVDVHTAMHRRPSMAMRQSGMVRQSTVGRQSAMFDIAQPWWKRAMVPVIAGLGAVGVAAGAWAVFGGGGGGATTGALDPERIAVLYFEDFSSDSALAPIADGLTEALIEELDRADLNVISVNGVQPFRGEDLPRDSVARALDVGTLVVGQLDPRPGGDVMVTTRIGREVDVRARRVGTTNSGAWATFLRGERARQEADAILRARSDEGVAEFLATADSLLQVAHEADPDWADPIVSQGWVALSRSQIQQGERAGNTIQQGLAFAATVLDSDARNADALFLRGSLRYRLWGLGVTTNEDESNQLLLGAKDDLELATEQNARLAGAYVMLSFIKYETLIDDVPGAMLDAQRGLDRDPYQRGADQLIDRMFWANLDQNFLGPAQSWCDRGVERFPDAFAFRRCRLWLMATPRLEPDTVRAKALVAEIDEILPDAPGANFLRGESRVVLGGIVGRAGDTAQARQILEEAERFSRTSGVDDEQELIGLVALMYAQYGDIDRSVDLLKVYVAANPQHGFVEAQGDVWWWRDVVGHPRWREVQALGN
jgi:serine/threonine-protein kinase